MKNLLPWLKSNWAILLLGIVAIVVLPAGWFFASKMNAGIVEKFQADVQRDFKDVSTAGARVPYGLTTPTGDKILEANVEANHNRNLAYQQIGEKLQTQTSVVSKAAVDHNSNNGKHERLIEGLFPAPSDLEKLSKPKEFAKKLLEVERPRLLKIIKAGMPPTPTEVAAELTQHVQGVRDQVKQTQGRDQLDAEETETLGKELLSMRLNRYQSRAAEIQVYADATMFDEVPADAVDKTASLAQVWDWQEKAWIDEDVLRAVAAANSGGAGAGGGGRGVPSSVIKRIMKLSIAPADYSPSSTDGVPQSAPFEEGENRAPADFTRSITGRWSGPGSKNKWYDVRKVTMEVVADARRLPAFFDALASTNFMTLIGIELTKVEPAIDLREGFFYGDDPVVKATLTIETVWFREWRDPWMPVDVKRALAMDKDAPAAETTATRPAPRGGGGRGGQPPPPQDGVRGGRRGATGGGD